MSQEENSSTEAGSMLIREIIAMTIGLLLVYWGKVEGPYLMTFLAYIMGAHYKTPSMRRGAIAGTFSGIRASLFAPPRTSEIEREKE